MFEFYTPLEKFYFLICGLIIVSAVVWVTHIYFEARVINLRWDKTFTTPSEFWNIDGRKNG